MLLLLTSCFNADNSNSETDRLKWRITRLEQRLDSLTNHNPVSYGTTQVSWRCQAITKRGTQCKRNAKGNSYCWQHNK